MGRIFVAEASPYLKKREYSQFLLRTPPSFNRKFSIKKIKLYKNMYIYIYKLYINIQTYTHTYIYINKIQVSIYFLFIGKIISGEASTSDSLRVSLILAGLASDCNFTLK